MPKNYLIGYINLKPIGPAKVILVQNSLERYGLSLRKQNNF